MITLPNNEALRASAAKHLWMANRDWAQMAEEGGPLIVVESDGIRVTDSEGKSWIDVNGGYISINAGHGRTEIAEAIAESVADYLAEPSVAKQHGTAGRKLVVAKFSGRKVLELHRELFHRLIAGQDAVE